VKWLFAVLLVLQAHFAASYLVPLDREAQATFRGLLRWAWPWSISDGGLLGRILACGEYPIGGWRGASTALSSEARTTLQPERYSPSQYPIRKGGR
jgi:hypothetical protein